MVSREIVSSIRRLIISLDQGIASHTLTTAPSASCTRPASPGSVPNRRRLHYSSFVKAHTKRGLVWAIGTVKRLKGEFLLYGCGCSVAKQGSGTGYRPENDRPQTDGVWRKTEGRLHSRCLSRAAE